MLSMALARNWARKLDTYSWSFLSSLSRILAVCRSMASTRFFSWEKTKKKLMYEASVLDH